MNPVELRKLANQLITREKWADILLRFIDVLKINIFFVDFEGRIILPPVKGRYGSDLLARAGIWGNLVPGAGEFVGRFDGQETYFEKVLPCELRCYAIPITAQDISAMAYLIVGPVILNKRLERQDFEKEADKFTMSVSELGDFLNEVRVISHMNLRSILDLLAEVLKYGIQLNLQRQELERLQVSQGVITAEVSEAAQDMYSSIYLDELLVALLDVALGMTRAECGSIMILDNEKGDLTIKVSRGIDKDMAQNTRLKVGEGIAGLVMKEKTSMVISDQHANNRIKHLLKRPEVKYSLVMPLMANNRVFGVLNIHTKNVENVISDQESHEIISKLSKLASTAMVNLQQKY